MRVLVTGGAGYIGSHTVVHLVAAGHTVVVADSLVNSSAEVMTRLKELTGVEIPLHVLDLTDVAGTDRLVGEQEVEAVIHFAGLKAVGESVRRPIDYYAANVGSTLSVLRAMGRHGVSRLVFSSSATVYGQEAPVPYHEDHEPLSATSPYGWTKVVQEQLIRDAAAADDRLRAALLRYFNPVGAHPSGRIGEDPRGIPNNLMPCVAQVAVGRRERLQVFGDDYPTPDGTPRRDYIHVEDLAAGHVAALDRLEDHDGVTVWNLGAGRPISVLEMIAAFERAAGRPVPYEIVDRRAGDLPEYYADPRRAEAELGWRAERGIEEMCADTWRWQESNPAGYRS